MLIFQVLPGKAQWPAAESAAAAWVGRPERDVLQRETVNHRVNGPCGRRSREQFGEIASETHNPGVNVSHGHTDALQQKGPMELRCELSDVSLELLFSFI